MDKIKKKLIWYLPAIPLIGLIPMLLYNALNDDVEKALCISEPELTVCCFLIQAATILVIFIELGIIVP